MRGVPLIDTSGLQAMSALNERLRRAGTTLMLAGAHDSIKAMLERGGLMEELGF